MREAVFLVQNEEKWREIEDIISNKTSSSPDYLAELYIDLTDDLAYAQTNYPKSKITIYLNDLTAGIFQEIYKRQKGKRNAFIYFWTHVLPLEFYKARKAFLYSFIFFLFSSLIGVVSTAYDETFPRVIMGDHYIDKTLRNMEKGDPMAVYKSESQEDMFFSITLNNIRVAFLAFACGIFLTLGTYVILFNNGVMLGTFQYFMYQKGFLFTSVLTIWIHGTIEIASIIIAGGAGIMMGNGFLFPGTYSRKKSFTKSAKSAVKIVVGLVPLFIIAGFLESYVTRNTHWPTAAKAFIILSSAAFILFYFVWYPQRLHKKINQYYS